MEAIIFAIILKAMWSQSTHDAVSHRGELYAAAHRKRASYEVVVFDRKARRRDR